MASEKTLRRWIQILLVVNVLAWAAVLAIYLLLDNGAV